MEKSASGRVIRVHPLAIASICDHHTRVTQGGSIFQKDAPVVGLLFGTQKGLVVDIVDATDAIYTVQDGKVVLDMLANFPDPNDPNNKNNKLDLVVAPFADIQYELLGWYSLGRSYEPEPWCLDLHQKFKAVNESPLFILMNHSPDDSTQLPMSVYESGVHNGVDNESVESFIALPFNLETSETERIAIDQVTRQGPAHGDISSLESQNKTLDTSVSILEQKVSLIISALERMQQSGEIDHDLLRKANSITQRLLADQSSEFQLSFAGELEDIFVTTVLGAATKTSAALAEVSELYTCAFQSRGSAGAVGFDE